MTNKDKTGTARQQERRKREREWLDANGFTSWEAMHTALMLGLLIVTPVLPQSEPKSTKKGSHS